MKQVIIENVIENSNIVVTEENSAYTKDFMVNNFLKLPWKGTNIVGDAVTVTITMPNTCNAIALYNIEATEIVFKLYDSNPTLVEETTYSIGAMTTYYELITGIVTNTMQRESLWIDYTYQSDVHTIVLEIKNSVGSVPSIGIIRGGLNTNLPYNPRIGLKEGLVDYSLKKTNANGSSYYQKKDIVRIFSGSSLMGRNTDFYKVMSQIAQEKGEEPLAWKITNLGQRQWEVFAKFNNMPSGSHDLINYSNLSWELIEAL